MAQLAEAFADLAHGENVALALNPIIILPIMQMVECGLVQIMGGAIEEAHAIANDEPIKSEQLDEGRNRIRDAILALITNANRRVCDTTEGKCHG